MLNARPVLRSVLIVCIAGVIGLVVSVVLVAQEEGFPLAMGSPSGVLSGPNVQSASGVIKTLYQLAVEAGYTDFDGLVATVGGLIDDGVPPGTILQVSRKLLSDPDCDPNKDLLSALTQLGQLIFDGMPPGQAANQVLGRGSANKDDNPSANKDDNPSGGNGDTTSNGNNDGNGNGNNDGNGNGNNGGNGNGNTGNNAGSGNGNGNNGGGKGNQD